MGRRFSRPDCRCKRGRGREGEAAVTGGQVAIDDLGSTIPSSKIGIVTYDARLGDGFDGEVSR